MVDRWTTTGATMPPATPAIKRLMFVFVLAFIIEKIAYFYPGLSTGSLALSFGHAFHPAQIITHIFLTGGSGLNGVIHLLFEIVILMSFGSELERLWGTYNFLRFFFTGLLGGVLLSALVAFTVLPGIMVYGFGAGLTAILVAYAMIWPDRQALFFFVIPLSMKWIVVIMLVFLALLGPLNLMILQSGGALAGALFLFYYARKGRVHSGYIMGGSSGREPILSGITGKWKEHQKKKRLEKKQKEINERIEMKAEVDRLLEKISREGMKALSRKEKSFLDRASKEF